MHYLELNGMDILQSIPIELLAILINNDICFKKRNNNRWWAILRDNFMITN
jgi:hypothetical protein